jgi:MFS family permease
MQDTAGTWLMTTLSASPLLIALMQTAASLPVLLLGFPAGGAADIFDRRRLLLFWQSWMLGAAVLLSLLSLTGSIVPWSLLGLTFLLNIGTAVNNPAWQAIMPELVPRPEVPDAVSLNSAGYNLARAVGPALGGVIVAGFALGQPGRRICIPVQRGLLCRSHLRPLPVATAAAEKVRPARGAFIRFAAIGIAIYSPFPAAAGDPNAGICVHRYSSARCGRCWLSSPTKISIRGRWATAF